MKKKSKTLFERNWIRACFNRLFLHLTKLNGDSHAISLGFAIGIFVALTPTVPFHTIIAIALAILMKASKPAAIVGVWFCNPLTIPFIYVFGYQLGAWLLHKNASPSIKIETISQLVSLGLKTSFAALFGGLLIGLFFALPAYFLARVLVNSIGLDQSRSGEKK